MLKNCSSELPWEQTVQHLNMMTMRMQFSGYNKMFRHEVIDAALKAYRKMKSKDQSGEVPLYRPKEWKTKERQNKKRQKKKTWYKEGGYNSVIFVPATPKSELKKMLDENVKDSGIKIKVVEKAGTNVKRILQRSDPFKERNCGREDCIVCSTEGKGPCKAADATYKITCKE